MISTKINLLFQFIDFLHSNIETFNKYNPLIEELILLKNKCSELNPNKNYKEKKEYDYLSSQLNEKFDYLSSCTASLIKKKAIELDICNSFDTPIFYFNGIEEEIDIFKKNFEENDKKVIIDFKRKYIDYRSNTHKTFLSMGFFFSSLDELTKRLFDFFKDTDENEFSSFEDEEINVNSLEDVAHGLMENKGKNVKFIVPNESIFTPPKNEVIDSNQTSIKNEIIMGDKIQVGNISNNSGQMNIGKENINESDGSESNKDLAKKSYNWQKWGIITASILGIIAIIVTILAAIMN